MVDDLDVVKENKKILQRAADNIIYRENWEQYQEIHRDIWQLGNDEFNLYFDEKWDTCTHMWVSY